MKTVLITGASGLIGAQMTEVLLAKGYNVIGTDKDPSPFMGRPNFSFVQAQIDDKDKITSVIGGSKIDALVHLACSVDNDLPAIITPVYEKISTNVDKYLFKEAVNAGIKDVMVLSTYQIYAVQKTREPIRETALEKPTTAYAKMKYDTEKAFSKALKPSTTGVIMRVCPIYTKEYVENLHSKIYDPKDGCSFVYGYGDYGYSFCCLYNLIDFVLGVLTQTTSSYQGVYNLCDTKPILAKEIVEFERQFHKLGAVIQRNYGTDAVKASLAFGSKSSKIDYTYNDLSVACSNISYDNTKAQRISTFRWKLSNTR